MSTVFVGLEGGEFGAAAALSGDGLRAAFVDLSNNVFYVYTYTGTTWVQMGDAIDPGSAGGDEIRIKLSHDGNVLLVGVPYAESSSSVGAGIVQMYVWNGTAWVARGAELGGLLAGNNFGADIALSSDGTRFIVGSPRSNGLVGEIYMYRWNGSSVVPVGASIPGGSVYDYFGRQVDINSSDGLTVVASGEYGANQGKVLVYSFVDTAWVQVGSTIVGAEDENLGSTSVKLSSDGTILAVSVTGYAYPINGSGAVRVYTLIGADWVQLGSDIVGVDASDPEYYDSNFSKELCLSADGSKIFVLSDYGDAATGDSYHSQKISSFEWSGTAWNTFIPEFFVGTSGTNYPIAVAAGGLELIIGMPDIGTGGEGAVYYTDGVEWLPMGEGVVRDFERELEDSVDSSESVDVLLNMIESFTEALSLLSEGSSAGSTFHLVATQGLRLLGRLALTTLATAEQTVNLTPSVAETAQRLMTLAEQIRLSANPSAQKHADALIAVTAQFSSLLSSGKGAAATETAEMTEALAQSLYAYLTVLEEAAILTVPESMLLIYLPVTDQAMLTPTTAGVGILRNLAAEGVAFAVNFGIGGQVYSGWVMNTKNFAVTEYQNFPFNSFCKIGSAYLGANSEGLYVLEGADDAGTTIDATFSLGITDFGSDKLKELDSIYLGFKLNGDMLLKTISEDGVERVYTVTGDTTKLHTKRVHPLAKGLRAMYWQLEMSNVDGVDFELDTVEFMPVVLSRRVR